MTFSRLSALVLGCLILATGRMTAQEDYLDFESGQWELQNAQVVQFMDRKCLIGTAFLKDLAFENGIIEFDLASTGEKVRAYPGLMFRIQSPGNFERLYLRPHRASLYPDAIQYTPCFNGVDSWQLYNGAGFTAGSSFPANQWLHFRLEVSGTQARLFWIDMNQPVLLITDLKHGQSSGGIGLICNPDQTVFFSNFRYQSTTGQSFPGFRDPEALPGVITNWKISRPFKFSEIDIEQQPESQQLKDLQWQTVQAEPSGLVDISRYYGRTSREPDCILARTILGAEKDKVIQLLFGYSDAITLFLNGKLLFFGNSFYQGRDPSFLGIIGYHDAVYLPLKKGENELLLWITEASGGWGFMARDGNAIFAHKNLAKSWEIKNQLRMPESAVYDPKRNAIYVSNFDRYSAPGQQFISKLALDGTQQQLVWVDSLFLPTGMAIFRDKLWAVERRAVATIDLNSGKILTRHLLPQPMFPNDIAIDPAGNVYISDSQKGAIYKLEQENVSEWLSGPELAGANGLAIHKGKLFAGVSSDHALKTIDLKEKSISTLVRFAEGIMDGLKVDPDGNILLSHYEGRIYRVTPAGEVTLLFYNPNTRCADFEFIAEKKLFVIPTLEDNKVFTYQYAH